MQNYSFINQKELTLLQQRKQKQTFLSTTMLLDQQKHASFHIRQTDVQDTI
jgi:hypothetical protein